MPGPNDPLFKVHSDARLRYEFLYGFKHHFLIDEVIGENWSVCIEGNNDHPNNDPNCFDNKHAGDTFDYYTTAGWTITVRTREFKAMEQGLDGKVYTTFNAPGETPIINSGTWTGNKLVWEKLGEHGGVIFRVALSVRWDGA